MNNNKMKNKMYDKIAGCLYGYAMGASLGMPAMLWPQNRVWTHFGWINDFLDAPNDNENAATLKAGQYSDNVKQAIVLMDSVIACQGTAVSEIIMHDLNEWAKNSATNPFLRQEILRNKENLTEHDSWRNLSSNCTMRAAPLGCLFTSNDENQFIESIAACCLPTHRSDITMAGSAVIAWCISRAVNNESWENVKMELPILADKVQTMYESTISPSLKRRIVFALKFSDNLKKCHDRNILRELYECLGAGNSILETVPTALAIANIAEGDPMRAATLAANLGGNTDVIGALATAICGAFSGITVFPQEVILKINKKNQIDFSEYAKSFLFLRS